MGYNLNIGEAIFDTDADEHYICIDVKGYTNEDCPEFIDSGKCNSRHPSYTQWSEFCKQVGLSEHFFGPGGDDGGERDGILGNHPGVYLLTKYDLMTFKKAKAEWLLKFPNVKAVTKDRMPENYYSTMDEKKKVDSEIPEEDWMFSRIEWLVFWTEWALKNCKNPTFRNG